MLQVFLLPICLFFSRVLLCMKYKRKTKCIAIAIFNTEKRDNVYDGRKKIEKDLDSQGNNKRVD